MKQIFVLAEHRQGQVRDITFEMLTKGTELAKTAAAGLTAVLLGGTEEQAKNLAQRANRVLFIQDEKLSNFNSELYQKALVSLIGEHKPLLTMIGHTSYGVELAPILAVSSNVPLATDCIDLNFENEELIITRQIYGGKVNVEAELREAESYLVTVRQASFPAETQTQMNGQIVKVPSPISEEVPEKRFIEYIQPPSGGIDITAADVLIGVGRGIKDESEIPQIEELANTMGGALACSRPIVDKGWLPDDRQVGSSGKTVKPKLYIALGISGAFQHVLGMKSSDLIIAVNKDSNAPIFSVADYGIVEDLFKIVPSLKSKIEELKSEKA